MSIHSVKHLRKSRCHHLEVEWGTLTLPRPLLNSGNRPVHRKLILLGVQTAKSRCPRKKSKTFS